MLNLKTATHDPVMQAWLERCDSIPQAKAPICPTNSWTPENLLEFESLFSKISKCFNFNTYPNQLDIITSDQMLDAYTTVGMPVMYHHSSFGLKFMQQRQAYKGGQMGLAYEIVINSNPCISFNMEDNPSYMQALVISHAAFGHNDFFANNYMFTEWTDAKNIIPYLEFAQEYISHCEDIVGRDAVEAIITSCHTLQNMGVDRYKRVKIQDPEARLSALREEIKKGHNPLIHTQEASALIKQVEAQFKNNMTRRVEYPHENLLYVLEKESPAALTSQVIGGSPWIVEVIRIIRMVSQYFYPQKQTQVMNEGWATYWHYTMCHIAWAKGYLTTSQMMSIIQSHTAVVAQPDYNSKFYSGINPYALGWNMYKDIMFMAMGPKTQDEQNHYDRNNYAKVFENREVFSGGKMVPLLGADWVDAMRYAMQNHRDDSFISNYLSPHMVKKFKLFNVGDYERNPATLVITGAHADFEEIRDQLSAQYNLGNLEPNIAVKKFDLYGDRRLVLEHTSTDGAPLDKGDAVEVIKHINRLLRGTKNDSPFHEFSAEITTVDTRTDKPTIIRYDD